MSSINTASPDTLIPMDAAPAGRALPTLRQAFRVWLKVAALSFGGPAGQIAVMHRILVEEKRWISESRFLHALNYCMLLPGPEAQQLATYIGWLMHRTLGGIMAGVLFVVPGIIAIMALSYVYAGYGNLPAIAASAIITRLRNARFPTRTTAWTTIASTAAFSPKNTASMKPTLP